MKRPWFARPLEMAAATFHADGTPNYGFILGVAVFGVTQLLAVSLASWHDHTLFLPSPGRGLLQHYGAVAILVSDVLFLVAAGYARTRFTLAMRDAPLTKDVQARKRWKSLVDRATGWIDGRGPSAYVYLLMVLLGAFGWITNVRKTIHPELPVNFSHDVFDGWSHIFGFVAFKFCLFTSWVIIFPIVGYLLVMMACGTWVTLHAAKRDKLLAARVTHPDRCYGFANFGELNVSLLAPFLLAYGVMLSLWLTHAKPYESLLLPMAGMTMVFLLVSYLTIYPLYDVIRAARSKLFDKLRDHNGDPESQNGMQFAIELLCYQSAKAGPYDSSTEAVLLAMRGITVAATAITLFGQYRGLVGI